MHFNLQCFQKCQGRYPNSPSIQLLWLGRSSFRPAWRPALVAPFTRSPSQFTAGQIQNLMREDLFLESQCRRLLLLHPLQQQAKDGRAENVVSLVVTVCQMKLGAFLCSSFLFWILFPSKIDSLLGGELYGALEFLFFLSSIIWLIWPNGHTWNHLENWISMSLKYMFISFCYVTIHICQWFHILAYLVFTAKMSFRHWQIRNRILCPLKATYLCCHSLQGDEVFTN